MLLNASPVSRSLMLLIYAVSRLCGVAYFWLLEPVWGFYNLEPLNGVFTPPAQALSPSSLAISSPISPFNKFLYTATLQERPVAAKIRRPYQAHAPTRSAPHLYLVTRL